MESFRPLAERLAASYRALIYDRRNCGGSDVAIDGALAEFEHWVEDLRALMAGLETTPAFLGGHSIGCTVSVQLAQRHPRDIKGSLLLGPGTSDPVIMRAFAEKYYGRCIERARRSGMAAIIQDTYFGQHLTLNGTNRERLLSMDVEAFCAVMERWREYVVLGMGTPSPE